MPVRYGRYCPGAVSSNAWDIVYHLLRGCWKETIVVFNYLLGTT